MQRKYNSKLIIHNETKLDDLTVLKYIERVVEKDKVSETSKGKQYCFATIYEKTNGERYVVISNKNKTNTFTFWIYKEDDREYNYE